MRNIILSITLVLASVSCSTTIKDKPATNTLSNTINVAMPSPVAIKAYDWKVLEDDSEAYICLDYNTSLEFRMLLEDMLRYIKDSKNVICYYKDVLEHKDVQCVQEQKDK